MATVKPVLTVESLSYSAGIPDRGRKGTGAAHYLAPAPVMLGSYEIRTLCGRSLGSSYDCETETGPSVPGTLCKRCESLYSGILARQEKAIAESQEAREDSAPVAEIPAEYVRDVVKASKRAQEKAKRDAAIAREKARLTARKAERAARDAEKSAPVARKPLDVKRVRAAVVAHALENGTPDGVTVTDSDCDAFVRELFAPEIGTDGKPWVPGDNPARRVPETAPVAEFLPGSEIIASTGKTLAQMRAETAAHYAKGNKPSDEIARLPAPGTVNLASGTVSSGALPVLPCEFKGAVTVINPERTHGKCPGCTAYIPLLPEKEARESGPKVSKEKCGGVGEKPKPGTRVMRDDHSVSVPDDFNGKHSGTCPGCDRVIAVSREGGMRRHNGVTAPVAPCGSVDEIGTHNVGGVPTPQLPAGKRLTSRSIDTVEHGTIPGDTSTADKRRRSESLCKGSRKLAHGANGGKATCPVCTREGLELREHKGAKKTTYRFPDHVSALPSVKHVGRGEIRDVTPRGDGADVGATVTPGARLALSRGHGSVDGSATTGRVNLPPVQPKGWLGIAGTGQLPATVRPGVDKGVTGDWCPVCEERVDIAHKGRTSSWKRRHAAKLRAYYDKRDAVRDAERAAKIASGEIIPTAERKAMRKAASVGSFSDGNCGGTVSHEPRPEFAPKGERRPAGWKAGKVTRDAARTALRSVGK